MATYAPRIADGTVLHGIVRDHLETFLAEAAARTDGVGLPAFVEREFRGFLRCGLLVHGFTRVRCDDCAFERLVPFSCKARAVCASCGGRRMAERAAHLVNEVLPAVPVRQWVLTVPHRLRYRLAFDHALCRAVVGVFVRAVLGAYRHRARRRGLPDGHGGGITVIQRFGSGLQLNVHAHTLALDGVFTEAADGTLRFHPGPPPTDAEVARLLATIRTRILRLLRRRGVLGESDAAETPDPVADASLALAGITSAAVQGRVALGPRAGARVLQIGRVPGLPWITSTGPRQAHLDGFDLHANVAIAVTNRDGLEQLARYVLRPPIAQERLTRTADGRVLLTLKAEWTDGTTHLLFEPVELLERLAALTPRPRINLVLHHGVLAPHSRWRARVVGYGRVRRRVRRTQGAAVTEYFYGDLSDPLRISAYRGPGGALTTLFHDQLGVLVAFERGAQRWFVGTDVAGSVRAIVDASGTIVRQVEYDAFGRVKSDTDAAFDFPFGFAGGLSDPVTALLRFGVRDYEPASGRWTARDPSFLGGAQFNFYAYVPSPVGQRDPWGLFCLGGSLYVGVGGGAKVCFEGNGWSACGEAGFGLGESVDVAPFAGADKNFNGFEAEGALGFGPIGIGGGTNWGNYGDPQAGEAGWCLRSGTTAKASLLITEVDLLDPLSSKLDPSKAEAAGDQLDDLFKKGSLGVAAQGKLIFKNCQRREYSLF